ncbi:hypothetical protein BJ741DRAFT_637757 [Chytriomyces cf. hyalinus JEL632]|nr:hypothetical protein BJ741DRAFT_637757 [Chytriomyces cf. hyalinus JEL632]
MDNSQCSCPSRSPVNQLFDASAAERARDPFDFDIDLEASGSKFGAAFDDASSAGFAVGPPPLADDSAEFGVENYIILMVGVAVYAVVAIRRYWMGLAEKRRKRESKLAFIPPPLRHRIISSNSASRSSPPPKSTLSTNEDSDAGYASPVVDSPPHAHVHSTQSTARSNKNRRRVSEEAAGSRHFHYTNHRANRKSANRNRHMLQESMLSESDFDATQAHQRLDPAGAHSDYASDAFQISKEPPHPSANTREPSLENATEKPNDTPAVVDSSFDLESPPKIAHDPSLTGSSLHTSSCNTKSQQPTTDTESKSNLSNSLKTTMTFEHSIRLKDGDDESGSLTSSTDKHQGSISGLGSFWRRSFSRPPSIHESSLGESPTGGGILPKLNIFKRKSNADLASLATGASTAGVPGASGDGCKSPIIPASPIATMMKGLWPTKQSAASSSSISKQALEPSTSESIVSTLAAAAVISTQKLSSSVPTLKLPKPGRKDKSKTELSQPVEIFPGMQELRAMSSSLSSSDISKSIKSGSESKRFWGSKSKSKKEQRNRLQTDGMALKEWSPHSGEPFVSSTERLVSDLTARTEHSLSSSPSASYANAATSVNDSNSAPFDPTIPYHDEEARNWVDDQRYPAEQRGSMESDDKHNMFNRLKWQSGGKQKSVKGLSRDNELKSVSGSSSTNSASKFFTLRKRASNETMKSEFIRLAATSKPFTPSYEHQGNAEPTYHLRDQFTPSPSRSMKIGPSPTDANYSASDYGRMLNHISGTRNYQLHYEQFSNPNYIHPNSVAVSDSDDGSFVLKSKRRSQPHSSFVEPIQRPNSATPSINSAPGSNRKTRSIGETATTPIASSDMQFMSPNGSSTDSTVLDSPLYSPFFSGFEIPMTQRPSPSFGSSAASSFAQSQLSRGSRHHHYHHHHHFYHHSGTLTEATEGTTTAMSTTSHHTDSAMSPLVNLPLANVKEHESDLRDSFKRLRKLSADAGLYTHQLLAAQRDSAGGVNAGGRVNAVSNRNKLSARSTGSLRMEDENEWNEDLQEIVNEDDMNRRAGFGLFDKEDGFY